MEDTFLDGIFLGMRLRSDEIVIGTARGVVKTSTQRRRVEEEQWDPHSPSSSKGSLDNLFLGSTATTFLQQFRTEQECAWKKIRRMLVWDNRIKGIDPPEAREVYRLVTRVRSDTLKRMYVARAVGKKHGPNTWLSRMCHDWQSSPSQSLGHMQGQDASRTGEE